MPPIRMNRRRFIGCSAAASLALGQGTLAEAVLVDGQASPVRLGVIGLGNRGTALLRSLLETAGYSDRRGLRHGSQAPVASAGDRRQGARPSARRPR